jgi:hypothetical protein
MATKATSYKALLNIANMDSHYYAEHNLTMVEKVSVPLPLSIAIFIILNAFYFTCGVVALESLRFQGRSPQQRHTACD